MEVRGLSSAESYYSYSKMEVMESCSFKYKLKHIDKYNYFTASIATELGKCIHSIEEDIAKAIKYHQQIDYTGFKKKLILKMYELEYMYPIAFFELDKGDRTYREKIYEYLESGIYRFEKFMQEHPTYEVVDLEKWFLVEVEGMVFKGAIDRVLRDTATGEIIIHDIKTNPVPKEHKELTTPLQFVVYIAAAKHLYGVEPEHVQCFYDLPFCDIRQEAGTKGFLARGIKKLHDLITAIEKGEFKPKPSPLCHWCDFCPTNPNQPKEVKGKVLCPYHSLWNKATKNRDVAETWQGLENHNIVVENYIKKYCASTV